MEKEVSGPCHIYLIYLERNVKCKIAGLDEKKEKKRNYPIMASKHEMVSTEASIPIRIFGGNNIDIIYDGLFYGTKIMGVTNVHKPNQHCHTEGEEKKVRLFGIFGSEMAVRLHPVNEIPFHGVYALAGTIMKQGRLAFIVYEYVQLLFHFQVAPVEGFVIPIDGTVWNVVRICCSIPSFSFPYCGSSSS